MLAAIALSLVQLLYRWSHPVTSELGRVGQSHDFVDIAHHDEAGAIPGVAIFRGDMNLAQKIEIDNATVRVDQKLKGRLDVRGAYDDFLDADITQKIAVGDLGAGASGVSMYLVGTITTSDGTFTFDETVNVSGSISARIDNP